MEASAEPLPILHPSMAERYRKEVSDLVESLNTEKHRTTSATLLRKLVDRIVLKPDPEGSGLLIDLHGDLAGILSMAANADNALDVSDLSLSQVKLVAGARNQLYRTRPVEAAFSF